MSDGPDKQIIVPLATLSFCAVVKKKPATKQPHIGRRNRRSSECLLAPINNHIDINEDWFHGAGKREEMEER